MERLFHFRTEVVGLDVIAQDDVANIDDVAQMTIDSDEIVCYSYLSNNRDYHTKIRILDNRHFHKLVFGVWL